MIIKKNQIKGVFKLAHDCSYLCSNLKQVEKKLKLAIKKKLKTKKPKITSDPLIILALSFVKIRIIK